MLGGYSDGNINASASSIGCQALTGGCVGSVPSTKGTIEYHLHLLYTSFQAVEVKTHVIKYMT